MLRLKFWILLKLLLLLQYQRKSKLDRYLLKCGFKRGVVDKNLYAKAKDEKLIVVFVCVDNIIFTSDSNLLTCHCMAFMKFEFKISMLARLSYFLGLHIMQNLKGIFISQRKYLKEVLKKFGIEECSLLSTPMVIGFKLSE